MPTYRYRCESCGDEFEVWQSITDDALTTHDASIDADSSRGGGCGGHIVKVLSPAGIVLKGSGFYKTDNRGSRSSKNGDGAKDSTSDGGSSDGSGDSGSGDSGSKSSDSKSSDSKSGASDSKSSDSKNGSSGSNAGSSGPGSSGPGSSSKPSKSGSTA